MTENAVNVTMVGLAVEHATEDQTIWDGEDGKGASEANVPASYYLISSSFTSFHSLRLIKARSISTNANFPTTPTTPSPQRDASATGSVRT